MGPEFANLVAGAPKLNDSATHYIYVGNYMPNALGLYDMQGSVDEWCLDAYQEDLGSNDVEDPVGPDPSNESYSLRGKNDKWVSYTSVIFSFGGQSWVSGTGNNWQLECLYTGYKTTRVVRGGTTRAASRSFCQSANNTGEIFTTGVKCDNESFVKLSISNPEHGVRVVVNVNE